ncbi:MAG: hypothetical protein GEU77_12650 [Deltaproteobacteria bacterium]|nr:hypothetical protein [Deltaproteobacteria bacterium]
MTPWHLRARSFHAEIFGFTLLVVIAFVATATAIALIVDLARVPVYLMTQGQDILNLWFVITASTAGVIIGTLVGAPILKRVPKKIFRRVVAAIVLLLGGVMLFSITQ